jgi:hypothetical protein
MYNFSNCRMSSNKFVGYAFINGFVIKIDELITLWKIFITAREQPS